MSGEIPADEGEEADSVGENPDSRYPIQLLCLTSPWYLLSINVKGLVIDMLTFKCERN